MTQFVLARDSKGHQIQSHGLSERQMLGQNASLMFFPCEVCGAVMLAMLKDIEGEMITEAQMLWGYCYTHPDAHKLIKIKDSPEDWKEK